MARLGSRVSLPVKMSHGPYQKKYLVSPEDMERLVDHYKGTLMENSRLTHAARLAAKQHVLLASPEIPPATKRIRVKALGPAVRRATKRVRTMSLPGAGGVAAGADEDDGDEFAQGPMETFLKTLIKNSAPQPKTTPKGKPKVPPKPKFPSKTPTLLPLPDDDWEEELAEPIPRTCARITGVRLWSALRCCLKHLQAWNIMPETR